MGKYDVRHELGMYLESSVSSGAGGWEIGWEGVTDARCSCYDGIHTGSSSLYTRLGSLPGQAKSLAPCVFSFFFF